MMYGARAPRPRWQTAIQFGGARNNDGQHLIEPVGFGTEHGTERMWRQRGRAPAPQSTLATYFFGRDSGGTSPDKR